MQNTKPNHPTEDDLERYILNRTREEELERLETHILACESCVTRLEDLEFEISATKLALQDFRREQLAKAEFPKENTWKAWFTVPKLSWTGAVATVALGLIVAPAFVPPRAPVAQVSLDMHLETADLAEGPVLVAVSNIRGVEVWKGSTAIHHEQAEVVVPPMTEKGAHFLRLYAAKQNGPDRDLLREFAFQVQ